MSRLHLKAKEVSNFGNIGMPQTMMARTRLCMEFNEALWGWFCLYHFTGKEKEVKANQKTLAEKFHMTKTMMLPPEIRKPYTVAYDAVQAINLLEEAGRKEKKSPQRRVKEQHALATLYERISTGIEATKPMIKYMGSRKWQNRLKGPNKAKIKEFCYESQHYLDKIVEEALVRHTKAVGRHYQLRLVNAIKTYDERAIAAEIKEALPVAADFESVQEAMDAAAVILRTMAEYKDEFADWAPPSKERLKALREHKKQVAVEDAEEAAEKERHAAAERRREEGIKLPPIKSPKSGKGRDKDASAGDAKQAGGTKQATDAKKAGEAKQTGGKEPQGAAAKILATLGEGETLGEKYERELTVLQDEIRKLKKENVSYSGQVRFLYAALTQEKKAMLRTSYDFELPPEIPDEDDDEDEEDPLAKYAAVVDDPKPPPAGGEVVQKKSLSLLHTTLEKHRRKVNEMIKKSAKHRIGGVLVLYDDYGNQFIQDIKLTKKIIDPREIRRKRKKESKDKAGKPGKKGSGGTDSKALTGLDGQPAKPGEYVMVESFCLHMDFDKSKLNKDRDQAFSESYLRDAAHLHRELAFCNPIGLAASLRYAADLCMRGRDFPSALGLYKKVVDIRRRKMGAHNPEVAQSIEYLGEIYMQMGNFEKALLLQEEALNMRLNIFGNTHVDVAMNLRSIATLQAMKGDFDEAVTLYTRALNILLKNFHKSHPQVEMVKVQLTQARQAKKDQLQRERDELARTVRQNIPEEHLNALDPPPPAEEEKKEDSDSDA